MENLELIEKIRAQLNQGVSPEVIKNNLQLQGMAAEAADALLTAAAPGGQTVWQASPPPALEQPAPEAAREKSSMPAISLGLGIAALVGWIFPFVGLPIAIAAIVLGAKGMRSSLSSMATFGLVLGIIGTIASTGFFAIGIYHGFTERRNEVESRLEIQEEESEGTFGISGATDNPSRYYNRDYHFSIDPPAGWVVDSNPEIEAHATFLNPEATAVGSLTFKTNIIIGSEPARGKGLDEYVEAVKNLMSQLLTGYEVTSIEDVSIGDIQAKLIEARYSYGQMNLKSVQLVAVDKSRDRGIAAVATILDAQWPREKEAVMGSLMSFRID